MGRGNFFLHDRNLVRFDDEDKPVQRFVYVELWEDDEDSEMSYAAFDDLTGAITGFCIKSRGESHRETRHIKEGMVTHEDYDLAVVLSDNQDSVCVTVAGVEDSDMTDSDLWAEVETFSEALWSYLYHECGFKMRVRTGPWTSRQFTPEKPVNHG
jgi:hypothetical protein